jgi:hypothetical protein
MKSYKSRAIDGINNRFSTTPLTLWARGRTLSTFN